MCRATYFDVQGINYLYCYLACKASIKALNLGLNYGHNRPKTDLSQDLVLVLTPTSFLTPANYSPALPYPVEYDDVDT